MPSLLFTTRNIFLASLLAASMLTALNYALIDNGVVKYGEGAFGSKNLEGLPAIAPLLKFLLFFSALYLYTFLNRNKVSAWLENYSFGISNILLGLCIAFGFFASARPYTLLTFVLLFLFLIAIEYINKIRFMSKLYRLYAVYLVPYWVLNYFLIEQGIMSFNKEMRIQLNVGVVPLENFVIWFVMLMVAVYTFERLQLTKKK